MKVPLSRTGSLKVNCAGGTEPSTDLTLNGSPSVLAVKIKFPPTPVALTIDDWELIKVLSFEVISTGLSPAVDVTVLATLFINTVYDSFAAIFGPVI